MKKLSFLVMSMIMFCGLQLSAQGAFGYEESTNNLYDYNNEKQLPSLSHDEYMFGSKDLTSPIQRTATLENPIVDPGGDPTGPPIPVGSGITILSVLGGAYFVATRRKEDKE